MNINRTLFKNFNAVMKLNWGTGIALVYGTFVLAMTGLVFASRKHDPGLVQKDYYNLDLHYQAHIEKKQNAAALPLLPAVQFREANKTVAIQFPSGMNVTDGTARFYRPATTGDDFTVDIKNADLLEVPAGNLAAGRWYVEFDWEAGGKKYFWETTVNVI